MLDHRVKMVAYLGIVTWILHMETWVYQPALKTQQTFQFGLLWVWAGVMDEFQVSFQPQQMYMQFKGGQFLLYSPNLAVDFRQYSFSYIQIIGWSTDRNILDQPFECNVAAGTYFAWDLMHFFFPDVCLNACLLAWCLSIWHCFCLAKFFLFPCLLKALIRKWAPVAIVLGVVFLLFWMKNKIWWCIQIALVSPACRWCIQLPLVFSSLLVIWDLAFWVFCMDGNNQAIWVFDGNPENEIGSGIRTERTKSVLVGP